MQILIHTVRMARILHIGQNFDNFQAFESDKSAIRMPKAFSSIREILEV